MMQLEIRRKMLASFVGIFVSICCFGNVLVPANERPNIIVILADDMGYSDLGCTGAEIETPNLDALAKSGVLFTHCYNTSRCCPSRAALLTGQYQWDAGLGHMNTTKSDLPEYQKALNDENVTIAEALQSDGYETVMSGKWHVGDKRDKWPDHRGFRHFYGTPTGGGIYFYPSKFYNRPVFKNGVKQTPDSSWYSTDGFTDFAVNFIKQNRDKSMPFFMYVAYIAPHFPLQAKKADIEKYAESYKVGYEAVRKARHSKQRNLGIVSADLPPSTSEFGDWVAAKNKKSIARKMAVYAAQVDCMDQNVGKLTAALKEEGIYENTVIMFLSDNGGCPNSFNKTPNAQIGSRDSNASYGKWYNVSNTPYRKAKSQVHEGGIITPLVMHWPAGIENVGSLVRQPIHIMDILPTCLEIAGTQYPTKFDSRKLDPIDGKSFADLVRSNGTKNSRKLFWEHQGNRAVRSGDWKLVSLHKEKWELYNLSVDPYEMNNLAGKQSGRVAELKSLYDDWATQHGVKSWPLKRKNKVRQVAD